MNEEQQPQDGWADVVVRVTAVAKVPVPKIIASAWFFDSDIYALLVASFAMAVAVAFVSVVMPIAADVSWRFSVAAKNAIIAVSRGIRHTGFFARLARAMPVVMR